MPPLGPPAAEAAPSALRKPLAVWLAGTTRFGDYLSMAERLAGEVADRGGRNPTLVLCEFEPVITIGRGGSRADVRLSDDDLRERRLAVRFTGRGGGAVVHGPGQVVAAVFARLEDLGLAADDVGGFMDRFLRGLAAAIATVRCGSGSVVPGLHGVAGGLPHRPRRHPQQRAGDEGWRGRLPHQTRQGRGIDRFGGARTREGARGGGSAGALCPADPP